MKQSYIYRRQTTKKWNQNSIWNRIRIQVRYARIRPDCC